LVVEPDAAPAGVPRKHAPGRRRGSAWWPTRAARQELGWRRSSKFGAATKSAARRR